MADLSAAAREAYVTAPVDVLILPTLELRHSTFNTEEEGPSPQRFVRSHAGIRATLEAEAPHNPNEEVGFVAIPFEFRLPRRAEGENIRMEVTLDAVDSQLWEVIENATKTQEPVFARFRQFRGIKQPDGTFQIQAPEYIFDFTFGNISGRGVTMVAQLTLPDFNNRPFPNVWYDSLTAPFLFRSSAGS